MKFLTLMLAAMMVLGHATTGDARTTLEKCQRAVAKIEKNYAACLKVADLLEAQGKVPDRGLCDRKHRTTVQTARDKFVTKLGVNQDACGFGNDAAATHALQLLASGEASEDDSLKEAGLPGTAADITSDNQTACVEAGGTWENDACTTASSYNCDLGALCSYWAAQLPEALSYYANNYVGDAPGVGPASGCDADRWAETWRVGSTFIELAVFSCFFSYSYPACE